ncbi:MAG TPA: DNA repair protein RecO [Verrucomicrobiae bacterium]|jgi:DNA repair protein RecO (recombination protein O)
MATESAIGIILRTRPLTETSLIVEWLTPEFGRIATVAKGARRTKSPFLGKLDLFYEAAFSFSRSRTSQLHNLREVSVREMHTGLRADILKLHQAAYGAVFIKQATEEDTPLPAVFNLYRNFLSQLRAPKIPAQIIFSLELKLLRELGLEPDWQETSLKPGTKKIAELLLKKDFLPADRLKLTAAQDEEISQFLHGFLIYHLGQLPKGRANALKLTGLLN